MTFPYKTVMDRTLTDSKGRILGIDVPIKVDVVGDDVGGGSNGEKGFFYGQVDEEVTITLDDNIPYRNYVLQGEFSYDIENDVILYNGNKALLVSYTILGGTNNFNAFFRLMDSEGSPISQFTNNIAIKTTNITSNFKNEFNLILSGDDVKNGISLNWYRTNDDVENEAMLRLEVGYTRISIMEI